VYVFSNFYTLSGIMELVFLNIHGGIYMRITGTDAAVTALKTGPDSQVKLNDSIPALQKKNNQENIPQQKNDKDKKDYPVNEKAVSEAVEKINKMLEVQTGDLSFRCIKRHRT
jgi:hypothetical protein